MCGIISTILLECDVSANSMSYYQWSIATVIFSFIGNWLFLVVIVFNLNALLRRQLDIGHSNMVFKIIPLAIIGIMGVLSGTLAGLTAYVNWYLSTAIWRYERNGLLALSLAAARLRIAYWILYLVSVLASGALALMTISSLRKAGKAGGVSNHTDISSGTTTNDVTTGSYRLGDRSYDCCCTLNDFFDRLVSMESLCYLRRFLRGHYDPVLSPQLFPDYWLRLHPVHCKARVLEEISRS
jgi:hypothetical protein